MDSTVAARYVPLEVVPATETPVSDIQFQFIKNYLLAIFVKLFIILDLSYNQILQNILKTCCYPTIVLP